MPLLGFEIPQAITENDIFQWWKEDGRSGIALSDPATAQEMGTIIRGRTEPDALERSKRATDSLL